MEQDPQENPGEIKRREVELDPQENPGEIERREVELGPQDSPGEIKRRDVELDPQENPGEIKRREVELGSESWNCLLLRLFLNSSATAIVLVTLCSAQQLKQQLRSTLVADAMARGHRLNIFVVLTAVHGLLGLPGRSARSSLHTLAPPPPPPPPTPLSPSQISHLASVDVKQNVYLIIL